jgi:hypothetical protein
MTVTQAVSDLAKQHTVAQLRQMLQEEFGQASPSKMRKIELAQWLDDKRHNAKLPVATISGPQVSAHVTEAGLQDFVGAALSAASGIGQVGGALQALGTVLHGQFEAFTAAERAELNDAKYQGRYAGRAAVVQIRRHLIEGIVVDRVHRGAELLLVLRHAKDAGHPRVTLHRAVDVLV